MVAMTKSELIARLAQRYPQLVAKDAEYAVKMILDAMTQSLLGGHRIEDLRTVLKEGDAVNAMIINVDRKNRSINLSVKAKDVSEETDAMKQMRTENAASAAGSTNLGALLRAKLDKSNPNPQQ